MLYPRSTDDVVKIVKTASKYGIPLIPYCAGTSLEGQSARGPLFVAIVLTRDLHQGTRPRSGIQTTRPRRLLRRNSLGMAMSKWTTSFRGWRSS